MKLAGIDMGSNATRLVIAESFDGKNIQIIRKIREPLRLGKDVFEYGYVRKKNLNRILQVMGEFKNELSQDEVLLLRAVATSAMREAKNKNEIVMKVEHNTGIKLDIIDGSLEAQLVCLAFSQTYPQERGRGFFFDIGGGSIEVGEVLQGELGVHRSFPLGTIRLLQLLKGEALKEEDFLFELDLSMKFVLDYIQKNMSEAEFLIGIGGNIECLGRLCEKFFGQGSRFEITIEEVQALLDIIGKMSFKERKSCLGLKKDRVDVIYPAVIVTYLIMEEMGFSSLKIPHIGLKEGVLFDLLRVNQ